MHRHMGERAEEDIHSRSLRLSACLQPTITLSSASHTHPHHVAWLGLDGDGVVQGSRGIGGQATAFDFVDTGGRAEA